MSSIKEEDKTIKDKSSSLLVRAGCFLLALALGFLLVNYAPVIKMELEYRWLQLQKSLQPETDNQEYVPEFSSLVLGISDNARAEGEDTDFFIIVPKINANALVIPNVDAFDISIYSKALKYGIAHAAGSALPGENGNTFLFAHSGRNFYENSGENVQFYLLDKLAIGDKAYLHYLGKVYTYEVFASKLVWPDEYEYLTNQNFDYNQLTLMSCWPAGVNFKRQVVIARLLSVV